MPSGYAARADRALVFKIEAWDANCPQHIPQRFEAEDVARLLAERDARIAELEETLKALQARIVYARQHDPPWGPVAIPRDDRYRYGASGRV